jgi:ActR/RegA family two-component response regulator
LERLRLATEAEVEAIKEGADLDASCQVVALTTQAGTPTAVIRLAVEVDPINLPAEFPDRLKAVFVRDIETHIASKGVTKYYFNIAADDLQWQEIAKTWGAVQVSHSPELRFVKVL